MKNITSFLFMFLVTFVGFSQGHETFDNFDTGNGTAYSDGNFIGQDSITWTYKQARSDAAAEIISNDQAIMLGKNRTPTSEVTSDTIANGIGTLEFTYMQAFGSDVELEVKINGNTVATVTTDDEQGDTKQSGTINVNVSGNFTITFSNPDGGQVNIDDVIWTAAGSDPTLSITSPTNNQEFAPEAEPSVSFNISNFDLSTNATSADGDGYIQYQIDSNGWIDYFSEDPIDLTGINSGNHTVTLQLADNNGTPLTPSISDTVDFIIKDYQTVNSIAELRAGDMGNYYTLNSEAILTYQQNFRNQKYIQDGTGAILIDDDDENITSTYNRNDGITGLTGKLTENNGIMELQPTADPGTATSSNNSVSPLVITLDDLNSNPEDYESQVIAIENVEFSDADGTITFETGTDYDINDGNDNSIMRTNFYDADYIGDVIPQGTLDNIVGIAAHFQSNGQIFMRDSDDINADLGVEKFSANDVVLYPNPADNNLNVQIDGQAQVQIYSLLGENLVNAQVSNQASIDVSNLSAGVYIVKIEKNGHAVSQKLVIR